MKNQDITISRVEDEHITVIHCVCSKHGTFVVRIPHEHSHQEVTIACGKCLSEDLDVVSREEFAGLNKGLL